MGHLRHPVVRVPPKKMNSGTLVLFTVGALITSVSAVSKPSNMKESSFLLSCRPPCEKDAVTMGIAGMESKRLCDCYCRTLFDNLTDTEVDYFKAHKTYSLKTRKLAEYAFMQCIKNKG
jgi:hypothetical protein